MHVLKQKMKEASLSIVPVVAMVLILNWTLTPVEGLKLARFLLGALLMILGLSVFLLGLDVGLDPFGKLMGSAVVKFNRVWVVVAAGLLLGFFISVAEPDLHILAGQVDAVTGGLVSKLGVVMVVSVGIAVMLAVGLMRIVYAIPLNWMLLVIYGGIFILALFTSPDFLAISFDASGATTGALTVPFVLALAVGVSSMKKDSKASEKDSFGLVAITSTGAILAVMLTGIIRGTGRLSGSLPAGGTDYAGVLPPFIKTLPHVALEVLVALFPIVVLFLLFQWLISRVEPNQRRRILLGLLYSFVGLVLLLTGVNAGFMEVGSLVGRALAQSCSKPVVVAVGFAVGLVTVLAEPAIHALTNQVEDVTSGYVNRRMVLAALSLGVGLAVGLSVVRIMVPALRLWHYLLPGYVLALALTFVAPKLFVGIAFDSGGVASGPMTATFVLAFTQGVAEAVQGADVLLDGFGVIAMVALTPLLTLQLLGLIYKIKTRKREGELHAGH